MGESNNAFVERLFAQHGHSLLAFLYRRLHRRSDAAELAQEVYLRILRLRDTTQIRDPEAYLYTVAGNLARERLAVEQRYVRGVDLEAALGPTPLRDLHDLLGQMDTEMRSKRLVELLKELPPKCRGVIALHYWHGLSYAEIAQQVGISNRMVKRYLNQALKHCRRRMGSLK
jgi:RNA polymerase sigma-70 factor (ECF subfamily)